MSAPTNPPAFPPNAGWRDNDPDCQGMTLLDWFAGQALVATITRDYGNDWGKMGVDHAPRAAAAAYAAGKAMMAERMKQ